MGLPSLWFDGSHLPRPFNAGEAPWSSHDHRVTFWGHGGCSARSERQLQPAVPGAALWPERVALPLPGAEGVLRSRRSRRGILAVTKFAGM